MLVTSSSPSMRELTALFSVVIVATSCRTREQDKKPDASTEAVLAASAVAAPTTTTVGPGRAEVEQACTELAERMCTTLARCDPEKISSIYGEPTDCRRDARAECLLDVAPPGSNATAASISKCAATTCDDVLNSSWRECIVPGPSPDGASCALGAECAGKFCKRDRAACGVCSRLPAAGEACLSNILCGGDLVCIHGRCSKRPRLGESCSNTSDCLGESSCFKGKCAVPAKIGQPCDFLGETARDCGKGLTCNAENRCVRPRWVNVGGTCNLESLCTGGATCIGDQCVRKGAERESCGGIHPCQTPLQCIDGVCTRLDRARCTPPAP